LRLYPPRGHLEEIVNLIKVCTTGLASRGIFQWDENYPNREISDRIYNFPRKPRSRLSMTWAEIRKLYPDQFVKFEITNSHVVGNKEYVDDAAIIKIITNDKEAMKEFFACKTGQFVYSTKNEEVIIELVKHIGIRRSI
jgi:hypothetical protein